MEVPPVVLDLEEMTVVLMAATALVIWNVRPAQEVYNGGSKNKNEDDPANYRS